MDVISLHVCGIQSRFQMSKEENKLVYERYHRCIGRSRLFSNSSHLEGEARIIYYTLNFFLLLLSSFFFPPHHFSSIEHSINFNLYFDVIKSRNRIIRGVYIAIQLHFIAHIPRSNIIPILHCQ